MSVGLYSTVRLGGALERPVQVSLLLERAAWTDYLNRVYFGFEFLELCFAGVGG